MSKYIQGCSTTSDSSHMSTFDHIFWKFIRRLLYLSSQEYRPKERKEAYAQQLIFISKTSSLSFFLLSRRSLSSCLESSSLSSVFMPYWSSAWASLLFELASSSYFKVSNPKAIYLLSSWFPGFFIRAICLLLCANSQ